MAAIVTNQPEIREKLEEEKQKEEQMSQSKKSKKKRANSSKIKHSFISVFNVPNTRDIRTSLHDDTTKSEYKVIVLHCLDIE